MTAIPDGSLKIFRVKPFFYTFLSFVFYVTYTGNKIMANFINLAGEARDFEQANLIIY